MVPHAMPKQEKAWFCSPAQSAGERAPESVATPATEVRAPEPTPVAPHERERRSTPPIPAPRVSWRLLLLSSSDTDTYIASESATAIFRFAREVFFFARVGGSVPRPSKGKLEFVGAGLQWIDNT